MIKFNGYVDSKDVGKVCKLHKPIYKFKKASHSWNLRVDEVVKEFVFIKSGKKVCVYKKASGSI